MKILLANKFLYPRGGDCLYTLRLMELLKLAGHEVIPFTMHHPLNIKTDYDKYFVSHIDFNEYSKKISLSGALNVASRSIINFEAIKNLNRLIDDTRPDIVHLQNIHHQLTPAIIGSATRHSIPVVWTLHDYILNCPNDNFHQGGHVCSKCLDGNYYHAIINRCKKNSHGASLLAATESYVYTPKKLAKKIARFICPSKFMANILIKSGLPIEKVQIIPNFLPPLNIESNGEDYFFYFGRLTAVKGINVLLEAFNNFGKGRLYIAGTGPQSDEYQLMCHRLGIKNVTFLGHQAPSSIYKLLAECKAVIVPSIWWENLPYSIMEAMAAGKPVIASNIGGIPEMIEHEINGLLFSAGSSIELTDMLDFIWNNPAKAHSMGKSGQEKVLSVYSPGKHYESIMRVYNDVSGHINFPTNNLANDVSQSIFENINTT